MANNFTPQSPNSVPYCIYLLLLTFGWQALPSCRNNRASLKLITNFLVVKKNILFQTSDMFCLLFIELKKNMAKRSVRDSTMKHEKQLNIDR